MSTFLHCSHHKKVFTVAVIFCEYAKRVVQCDYDEHVKEYPLSLTINNTLSTHCCTHTLCHVGRVISSFARIIFTRKLLLFAWLNLLSLS